MREARSLSTLQRICRKVVAARMHRPTWFGTAVTVRKRRRPLRRYVVVDHGRRPSLGHWTPSMVEHWLDRADQRFPSHIRSVTLIDAPTGVAVGGFWRARP